MSAVLTFDEASHAYFVDGLRVPSVTQILAPLSSFEGIPPAVLEAKRDLGTRVHLACQLHDENDLDEDSVEADVAPYLAGYRAFLRDTGATVLMNEVRVFDAGLMVAGTLDRVFALGGAKVLVDIKTCIAAPASVGAQTAGYMRLLADPSVRRRAALRLRPDRTYRLDTLTGVDDFSVFMACLCLHRYKETHA